MRKGGGKQKGAAFERQICKQLSRWVSGEEREDIFWRSAMSGGRATVMLKSNKKARAQVGDVSAVDSAGQIFIDKFYVECKFLKDLNLGAFITRQSLGGIVQIWRDLIGDSAQYDKFPFLVAKQNQYPTLLILDGRGEAIFRPYGHARETNSVFKTLTVTVPLENMHIHLFDRFLIAAKPPKAKPKKRKLKRRRFSK